MDNIKNKPKVVEVSAFRAAQLFNVSSRSIQRWCDDRKLVSLRNHPTAPWRVFIPENEYELRKNEYEQRKKQSGFKK